MDLAGRRNLHSNVHISHGQWAEASWGSWSHFSVTPAGLSSASHEPQAYHPSFSLPCSLQTQQTEALHTCCKWLVMGKTRNRLGSRVKEEKYAFSITDWALKYWPRKVMFPVERGQSPAEIWRQGPQPSLGTATIWTSEAPIFSAKHTNPDTHHQTYTHLFIYCTVFLSLRHVCHGWGRGSVLFSALFWVSQSWQLVGAQ